MNIREILNSTGNIWAIMQSELASMIKTIAAGDMDVTAVHEQRKGFTAGNTAVIPIMGPITRRADFFTLLFGGASIDGLTEQFNAALADSSIGRIVLNIDSPGGEVAGVEEFAATVFAARGVKPVVAVVNSLAASAAYWIAAQAEDIAMAPGSLVGSIGTLAIHQEFSKALESDGVGTTIISAGKKKTEGNPFEPLTEEAKASIQGHVDEAFHTFVKAVARGRGVTASDVKAGFGEGGVVGPKEAVSLGMVDRIASLDDVLSAGKRIKRDVKAATPGFDLEARGRRWRYAEAAM